MHILHWLLSFFACLWTSLINSDDSHQGFWTESLSNGNRNFSFESSFLPIPIEVEERQAFPEIRKDIEDKDQYFNAFPILVKLVDRSYFYGEWININGNYIRQFKNDGGFNILHYDSLANFKLDLHLYDGEYIDGNTMSIMYNHTGDVPFHFNQSNATLQIDNFELIYQIGRVYGDLGEPISCASNLTIYFINLTNDKPFIIYDLGQYDPNLIGIQIRFETSECPINIITSVMSKYDQLFESQALYYIAILSVMTTLQCVLLVLFDKSIERKPYVARRTSAWSLVMLNAFDLYFFLSVAYFFMNYSPLYELSTIPCAFLAFCFEPRVVWKILQANRNLIETNQNQTNREIKTYFCMLFLFMCVLGSLVIFPDFSYVLSATYLIPQIVHNFQTSIKYRWNYWIIGGLSVPKVIYILYSKLDANNMLRITPDTKVVIVYICAIVVQLFILAIQTRWPRFGYELEPVYKVYTAKTPRAQQDLCAICLEKLKDSFAGSSPSTSFIGTDTTLKDRRKILTPCKHEFHLGCLGKWLDSKLECPYCRKCLPLIPEEYLDE